MRTASLKRWLIAAASLVAFTGTAQVLANEGLEKPMKDPNYWVYPGGNYWNWRYSELNQINNTNGRSSRLRGRSPPVCCADTKVARWCCRPRPRG